MLDFEFYNPTKIVFGKDKIEKLNDLVDKDARVLILYGGGSIKKFGTLDKVKEALKGREIFEFSGIEPNPKYETLMKAVEVVKKENINFLLAVGGGSVMDGTKFVNLAANYDGEDKTDLLKYGFTPVPVSKGLPIGTVVTLPATGSEMNGGAVISYDGGKFSVRSPLSFPKFSILDPTLTYTLPKTQVANGVVDTFIHVLEQYATYPVDARFQDRTAEGILKTLIEIGRKTIDNPTDYDARVNLVWCATMGLNGLIAAGVPQDWTTHKIGHELTAIYGIDHAKTLATILPALWEVRRKEKGAKIVQYAERVWDIKEGSDDEKIDLAISKTREFFESLDMPTHLSKYGLTKDDVDTVVDSLNRHGMTNLSETGDLGLDISRKVIEKAL
ncbi:iron-containing alcohol dehydrogenase [[Eubacterium] tenue]|nr:iron-containing alcohol dehydrogenase [[Eubacterium] tenue]MBC8630097.1 iron-containing alcohol dehydrogenase [[Eubacterium] tenue]